MGSATCAWLSLQFFIIFNGGVHCQRPVVQIPDGTLMGTTFGTFRGRNINGFLGVPFAEPPLGSLRFMAPVPNRRWEGVLDAGSYAYECTQVMNYGPGAPRYFGNEDCLYLNVFTPMASENRTRLLPVLLFIHWGAFSFGSGNFEGARYILDYDLIFVTFNYRLDVLGYLSAQAPELPGNAGMMDQILAMQWVQKNIAYFGGNPNDVTIAGTSAGSVSVHLHMLSPISRGLFHRAILQSGVGTTPYGVQKQPRHNFLRLVETVGCVRNETAAIIACLQQIPALDLIEVTSTFQKFFSFPFVVFGPVVQFEFPNAFLPRPPYDLMRTGHIANVPTLISTVSHEGLFPVAAFAANETALNYLNENWNEVAPYLLDYVASVDPATSDNTSQIVRNFYFADQPVSDATIFNLIGLTTDRLFVDDIVTSARWTTHFNVEPVYFYRFAYRGAYSYSNFLSGTDINYGASHPDDSFYILNATFFDAESTASDREMVTIMTGIWGNFVTTGTPLTGNGITLEPLIRANALDGPLNYLMIDSPEQIARNTSYGFGHTSFWNHLPLKEAFFGRPINIDL